MENNIAFQSQQADICSLLHNAFNAGLLRNITNSAFLRDLAGTVKKPVEWLRGYYSSVCGKSLTMAQTLLLVNTQFAFLFTALPTVMPVVARLAGMVWLLASLWKCKKSI